MVLPAGYSAPTKKGGSKSPRVMSETTPGTHTYTHTRSAKARLRTLLYTPPVSLSFPYKFGCRRFDFERGAKFLTTYTNVILLEEEENNYYFPLDFKL